MRTKLKSVTTCGCHVTIKHSVTEMLLAAREICRVLLVQMEQQKGQSVSVGVWQLRNQPIQDGGPVISTRQRYNINTKPRDPDTPVFSRVCVCVCAPPETSMNFWCSLKVMSGSCSFLRKSLRRPHTTWMSWTLSSMGGVLPCRKRCLSSFIRRSPPGTLYRPF